MSHNVMIQKSMFSDIIWKFSLEDDTRALEDAKKALHFDGTSVKARRVCAESLFASGQFELGKFNYKFDIHHNVEVLFSFG